MLWLPVALGLGIAIYYELPSEPPLWAGPAAAAAALAAWVMSLAGGFARALWMGAAVSSIGFGLITWRTADLAAPTLARPLFSLNVEGRVADIQRLPEGVRVVLEAVRLKGQGAPPPEATPLRVRVSLTRGQPPAMQVGEVAAVLDEVDVRAVDHEEWGLRV